MARKSAKTYVIRFAGHAGLAVLFILVALLGVLSGVLFAYAGDLPLISGPRRIHTKRDHPRLRVQWRNAG